MELLDRLCDPGLAGLDVGAKVGMYTYRMARLCSEVIAFEPISELAAVVRSGSPRNVTVHECALAAADGSAEIRIPLSPAGRVRYGRSTIAQDNSFGALQVAGVMKRSVETRRLDGFELPKVGFVKIDVEGSELAVLNGAARFFERDRPKLLIELNDLHDPSVPEVYDWLSVRGYRPHGYKEQSLRAIEGPARQPSENVIFLPDGTSRGAIGA